MPPVARLALTLLVLTPLACASPPQQSPEANQAPVALVIHGGAGAIRRGELSADREAEYRDALRAALEAGHRMLRDGAASLDVVENVIRRLEDDALFNAGRGAVFTSDGQNELDASIMDGSTTLAGAVAGVTTIQNPISAARAVMEKTEHVLLAGEGAEEFAARQGLEIVDPQYFWTERRWQSLERARSKERGSGGEDSFGTVGAVALDREGRLAAGTSTGGMTNKKHGRIGDSPIIGAGTYANDRCGVSATGHGEYFIRFAVAFDICSRLRDADSTIGTAADEVVHGILAAVGGEGGVIALDADGTPALVFNTDGMYRGHVLADGEPRVAIFNDE